MDTKTKYVQLIDTILNGDYKKSQGIVDQIVSEKMENRIQSASIEFLAIIQGK
jgi:DNA polymerase III delta subunit